MIIKPSTALRNEYAEISRVAKETGEPIYLTKNGEGDLVVMSLAAFEKKQRLLELREKLLEAEEVQFAGAPIYTHDEVKHRYAVKAHKGAGTSV